MNNDYDLPQLVHIVDKVRPQGSSDDLWMDRYLRLNVVLVYLGYAVATAHSQEENIARMAGGQHKIFTTHQEYGDCLNKIYASAVNAYSNIRTCLETTRALIDEIPRDHQSEGFREFRTMNSEWVQDVIDRRDRVAIHPGQNKKQIVWKPNGWSDNGEVYFHVVNPVIPTGSRKIKLQPKEDLNSLRGYLYELPSHLEHSWWETGMSEG